MWCCQFPKNSWTSDRMVLTFSVEADENRVHCVRKTYLHNVLKELYLTILLLFLTKFVFCTYAFLNLKHNQYFHICLSLLTFYFICCSTYHPCILLLSFFKFIFLLCSKSVSYKWMLAYSSIFTYSSIFFFLHLATIFLTYVLCFHLSFLGFYHRSILNL